MIKADSQDKGSILDNVTHLISQIMTKKRRFTKDGMVLA